MISDLIFAYCFNWEALFVVANAVLLYLLLAWLRNPLRQIPGPKGSMLLGNSSDLSKPNDGHKVLIDWGKKYGDIYKTWDIIGKTHVLLHSQELLFLLYQLIVMVGNITFTTGNISRARIIWEKQCRGPGVVRWGAGLTICVTFCSIILGLSAFVSMWHT